MKKWNGKKALLWLALAAACMAGYLFYSRPLTIHQRYPMLSMEKCYGIAGYFEIGMKEEPSVFQLGQKEESFEQLYGLLCDRSYRRTLRDLLPERTRIHFTQPDDFQWDISLQFEDVLLPDGSTGSGSLLHIQNWYGQIQITFDGVTLSCKTEEQETWLKEVLQIIQQSKQRP